MIPTPAAEAAPELARRIVDEAAALPDASEPAAATALGWALKDLCYASWNSDPARASRAASALGALARSMQADDGELAALAQWTGGIAQLTRGEMADAVTSFDHAHAAFASCGAAHAAAQTQVPKIVALSMLGRHDEAARCALAAQQAFLALDDRHAAGRVSLNLGTLHWRRGDYAEAARHSREAVLLFARVGDREHSVMADIGLADALTALGDPEEALRIYARARMRARTHGLPVLEAIAEESVALLDLARGHYRDALAGLEAARRAYAGLGLAQQLAVAEKQLGDAYLELRLLPEALDLFDEAWRRFEQLALPDEEAWVLVQRGRVLALLDNAASAAEALQTAADLFERQGNGVGAAAVALARAELALARGDATSALAFARQSKTAYSAAGQAERGARADTCCAQALLQLHDRVAARALFDATLSTARTLGLVPVELACLVGIGQCEQADARLEQARAAHVAAVELFETQSAVLPGDEIRSAYLNQALVAYRELLRLALLALAGSPDPAHAMHAWQALERHRARALADRMQRPAEADDPESVQATRSRVQWLGRRVEKLRDDGEPVGALLDALQGAERELLEQARRARLARPAPAAAPVADELARPDEWIDDGTILVEYGVLDDELLAFVVGRGKVQVARNLASWRAVVEATQSMRLQIETLRHGAGPVLAHLARIEARTRARLQRLHELIWAPLTGRLEGARRVLIVPHGLLGSVPFAALHDGNACLGETMELALAPSARVASRTLSRGGATPRDALVVAEPTGLPHAAEEARLVASMFDGARTLSGAQATSTALRSNAADADLIHFACHAHFRADNPVFSALRLHDGGLTVEAVETLPLRSQLVVLSACETGVAASDSAQEAFGLVRAFLVAGAARVLASLWPVDDAATADFMLEFYRALCDGRRPAEALRIAQHNIRARHPHPFYWAAFVLHGGF